MWPVSAASGAQLCELRELPLVPDVAVTLLPGLISGPSVRGWGCERSRPGALARVASAQVCQGTCTCGIRYDRCLFVIHDLGFIRDTAEFSCDIEGEPDVYVLTVKK